MDKIRINAIAAAALAPVLAPVLALVLALPGCTTMVEADDAPGTTPGAAPGTTPASNADELLGQCNSEAGQELIGQKASAETGKRLLRVTGTRQLRWAPPDAVLTMDYRADRLTVGYDEDMIIRRVSCG